MTSLGPLLAPRSVAVVGASDDPGKIGGRPVDYLRRYRFSGGIYPVNPSRTVVQGLACYPDVASLPEVPDAALIVVPGAAALAAVEGCAAAGVGAAVVLSSGFGEMSAEGKRAQDRMVAAARDAGMRLVGPNCQGVANISTGAILSFSTMFLELPPVDGPLAVVSQSGSMSQVPYALLHSLGIGLRYTAATGNEADVSAAELATALAEDPDVGLILLYLETVRDAQWLAELGRVAAARHLPVVALKSGTTPSGQAAALSHTGALANEDRVVDAFLERVGIQRARDLKDLVSAAELYLRPSWRPGSGRLAVVSNSGASCVQAADAMDAHGLAVAGLAPETLDHLTRLLPPFATATNPVDLTAALIGNSRLLSDVLPPLAADAAVDALLVALPIAGEGYDLDALATDAGAVATSGTPTVVVATHVPVAQRFHQAGLPVFATEAEAVAALGQWKMWWERSQAAGRRPHTVPPPWEPETPGPETLELETLDESASLALLTRAGVPVVDHRLCADVDAALSAFEVLGPRVALKGCTALVTHKSDVGLVTLGVGTGEEVRAAFAEIDARLRQIDPAPAGVLVQRMAAPGRELMIGARRDPIFGPVVLVGTGGAYVEVQPDLAVLLWPFEIGDVPAALARLRLAPLLAGVRGEAAADVAAFSSTAVAVGALLAGDHTLAEIDLNPVMVGPAGTGCVAVDAVVRRRVG
jgi:acyl-CoA synthetase (NDP forming)